MNLNITEIKESLDKKLNKKEKLLLNSILKDLYKAEEFILRQEIRLCRVDQMPYGTSFINKEGKSLSEINKHVGSDLCYMYNAIDRLQNLLKESES